MSTASEKIAELQSKIASNPAAAQSIGATYKFVLTGDGGGTWLVNLKDAPGITEGDGAADCTLTLAADDFVQLLDDPASGQHLFFSGKLQVDGDIGLALKLQQLTEL